MSQHNKMSPVSEAFCLSCLLLTGEVSGAGYGLPHVWWAGDHHTSTTSLCLPLGSASGRVEAQLPVPDRAVRNGGGAAWCPGLHLFLHHNGAKSLSHRTVLLHDMCGWENLQTSEWGLCVVHRADTMSWLIGVLVGQNKIFYRISNQFVNWKKVNRCDNENNFVASLIEWTILLLSITSNLSIKLKWEMTIII